MNAVKIALLGTAALAAVSVSAQANDLADLKAQIEGLNSRISQLESTPSVPAGYQLLSVSTADAIIVPGLNSTMDKNYGTKAHNIGVMPTADVPASTNIQWSGFVRAGVLYRNKKTTTTTTTVVVAPALPVVTVTSARDRSVDITTRAGLKVVATTDTAVGEVGVRIALLSEKGTHGKFNRGNASVTTDGYWGWWKITPELTLGGGVDGSLAGSSNAFDNRCTCAYIQTGGAIGSHSDDPSQIRLSYASGPISFAVAVEDEDNNVLHGSGPGTKSALGVAGEMKYSGDAFGFDLSAGYWDSSAPGADEDWTVNAGANMGLGDIANLGVAVGVGEDGHVAGNSDRYTKASAFLGFTLSDSVTAEIGGLWKDGKGNRDSYTIGTGIYYTPVSQLTLGLEASYQRSEDQGFNAAVVAPAAPASNFTSKTRETRVDAIAVWRF
jgi:opacity protein-like surface antigen